ncbi:MAG: hypothetical protein Q7S12_04135 [bacterium]|nr:hypothetical protein [bacterium]
MKVTFCFLFILVLLVPFTTGAQEWYYSASEISAVYRYQYDYGRRLKNPVSCDVSGGNCTANFKGKKIGVPEKFLNEVKRHIVEMLKTGAARYVFELDAGHGHFALPKDTLEHYWEKYDDRVELLEAVLRDQNLSVLYHTAEHLKVTENDPADVKDWQAKRNVLAGFDGSQIKILEPTKNGVGRGVESPLNSFGGMNFSVHKNGNLFLYVKSEDGRMYALSLDISFDDNFSD